MNIIIATDSFKGSLSSLEAAEAIERGILRAMPNASIKKIPVADGGEGTVDALISAIGGKIRTVEVTAPLGNKVQASYAHFNNGVAVIEMAAASGLALVPDGQKNPLITTSYGTGELIRDALDYGYRKIMIGIGGSATNDGGIGMAQALGVSLQDEQGLELGFGGRALAKLSNIDVTKEHKGLKDCEITVLCDVNNLLCGKDGASAVYGPQKGATKEMIDLLDANLRHYADRIKAQLGQNVLTIKGGGAAGGMGVALTVFCGAHLKSGIQAILDMIDFNQYLPTADLVITGEGKMDGQSINGKVPIGIARRAQEYKVPVIAIAGSIGAEADRVYDYGISGIAGIIDQPMSLEYAMAHADVLLENAAKRVMCMILTGNRIKKGESSWRI